MVKGEHVEEVGNVKRKRMMRRISEWERFEANCSKIKELESDSDAFHAEDDTREQINQILDRMKCKSVKRQRSARRPYSIGCPPGIISDNKETLPKDDKNMSLDEKIMLWKTNDVVKFRKHRKRANSLPALIEEAEEEESLSVKNKRRSKSIDSYVIS